MTADLTPLDVLRRDGWCKQIWRDEQGRHCLMGAFLEVYGENNTWVGYSEVQDVVREQFPDRGGLAGACEILFNNHPDTTFADVELVLEKAQLRYDETVR